MATTGTEDQLAEVRQENELTTEQRGELRWLNILAWGGSVYLIVIAVASIAGGLYLLASGIQSAMQFSTAALCVLAGTLGSSMAALRSLVQRRAHGVEFVNGTPYPQKEPPDKFNANLIQGFVARPVIGAGMGLLVYLGILSGLLGLWESATKEQITSVGLVFLCLVGGLFAKTLWDKLSRSQPK